MTNEADNPERIEREIEHDRDALRRTLNDLQDELSLDGFTRRMTDKFRENGSEWANAASDAARANPVALALTGVGLAWLIFGRGYDPTHRAADHRVRRRSSDWDRPSDPYYVSPNGTDADGTGNIGIQPVPSSSRGGWSTTGSGAHHSDRDSGGGSGLGRMTEGLRQKAQGWRDRISDGSGSLHDRLSEGTEGLSEEARRRVYDARRRAVEARETAARRLRESSRTVSRGYDSEPLFFGAAAAALGAGLACLLPRTRQEDELLGSYSDQLFHEAESIFEEEKAKVQNAVAAGLEEAKSAAGQVTAAAQKELGHGSTESDSGGSSQDSRAGPGSASVGQSGRPGSAT
ncbi:DUF3618 domain-containing protein [Paracoccus benzoatiresistens]|uniref:DUF3618 domain-containing protein n=1 Tax=Paracoccus benzoatiresistens TaxID=2997341 RepID=A0ABT4J8Z4_9RHOB|nr:DUF3618 domain-containing protein [Paracoccus sp. EF6]MCZ0963588.1 DUF3618 domain-containing protein [Paracoccus sp. EF6]